MRPAPLPEDEEQRLAALRELHVLDTAEEADFNEIVQLASQLCETPISLISLIDEHRQWFKARVGLDVQETHRDFAFCAHAIHGPDVMIVPDTAHDPRFDNNPLVLREPHIRFYAGMPLITPGGYRLGTLCVIDRVPKQLTEQQLFALRVLGKQVIKQFELRLRIRQLRQALQMVEEQRANLQQLNHTNSRLLSIIGHDLRSPLSSLTGLVLLAQRGNITPAEFSQLANNIRASLQSTDDLLSNLMLWATSQFEGRQPHPIAFSLARVAHDVVSQNQYVINQKQNEVVISFPNDLIVYSDKNSIEFVLRNLVMNANKFSAGKQIVIRAGKKQSEVIVQVVDQGIGIEPERQQNLFQWESRRSTQGTDGEKGTGLGLQVCKELIEKLGGSIHVTSTPGKGSTFTFTIPQAAS